VAEETSEELFFDVAGLGEVVEGDTIVQWDVLSNAKVIDDTETHGIVGLEICALDKSNEQASEGYIRTDNMIREILLKLKPFAPRARAFSVSVASMSCLRTESSLADRPERVSSKKVGDFGTAPWSVFAIFKISSASSTKVGELCLTDPMIVQGEGLLMKTDEFLRLQRRNYLDCFRRGPPGNVQERF